MANKNVIKPKHTNYRVCYESGNPITGNEIYELQKLCKCQDCRDRANYRRGTVNRATATTRDISKVDEVAEFLKKWHCKDGKQQLKTAYFNF